MFIIFICIVLFIVYYVIVNKIFISITILEYESETDIANFAARLCPSNPPSSLSKSHAS